MRKSKYGLLLPLLVMLVGCKQNPAESLATRTRERMAELSAAGELSTVEYTVTKMVKTNDQAWYKLGDRKILFHCRAYLEAGVNLKAYDAAKTEIDEQTRSITLTLPQPRLLSLNMPIEEVGVAYEKVTLLRSDFSAEDRTQILQQGEKDIRADIPTMGILTDAEQNTRTFFTTLLRQLGYSNITIKFEEEKS